MSGFEEKKLAVTTHDVEVESESELKPSANFLTISRPSPSRQTTACVLPTIHDVDSAHTISLPPTPSYEKSIETSFAYTVSRDRNDTYSDLEAQGLTEQKTGASQSKSGLITQKCRKMDSAWPGRNHMKQQRKAQKLQRAQCACWARLSKLFKSLIVTVIVLAVLGIALGLGFGLSQKVGGTVYDGSGNNKPVRRK